MMIHNFTGVLYIYRRMTVALATKVNDVGPEIFERLRLAMQSDVLWRLFSGVRDGCV